MKHREKHRTKSDYDVKCIRHLGNINLPTE